MSFTLFGILLNSIQFGEGVVLEVGDNLLWTLSITNIGL